MKPPSSIKSISYLKAHTFELINEVTNKRSPLLITQNGHTKAIIQDIESYEQTQESLAMLKMIAQSQQNIKDAKTKPARQALKSIRSILKISD